MGAVVHFRAKVLAIISNKGELLSFIELCILYRQLYKVETAALYEAPLDVSFCLQCSCATC